MRHLLLLLCLCVPLSALADTEEDKGRLTRFLEDSLSGAGRTVTVDGFTGALSSKASVETLTIADVKGIWLRLENVTLDWNRSALFSGALSVNSLAAKTITLSRPPESDPAAPTPEATPFSLPDLPVSVQIGDIKADKIALGAPVLGQALTAKLAGKLSLIGGAGDADLTLTRTDDIKGAFALKAAFDNTTRRLLIDLAAEEARAGAVATLLNVPDRPALALTLKGDAPLSEFRAELSLATDGVQRVSGSLETANQAKTETVPAQQSFFLDINGDISPLVKAQFRPFFGTEANLTAKARQSDDGRVTLDHLLLSTAAMRIAGEAVIAPSNLPESFALDIDLSKQGAVALLLPASLDLSLQSATLKARYDATQSDAWTLSGTIRDFIHPDVTTATIALSGGGRIRPEAPRLLTAEMRLVANGLRPTDAARPEVARALGEKANLDLGLAWQDQSPVQINRLTLTTASGTLDATAQIDGPPLDPTVTTRATANLGDLAALAPLAGRPLRGTLDASIQGTIQPLAGAFDLSMTGESDGLRTGMAEVDTLTETGLSQVAIKVKRDGEGLTWRDGLLETPALSATTAGALRTGGGTISLDASLDTLSRYLPSVSGPATLTAVAKGVNGLWELTLDGTGPGNARLSLSGQSQGIDPLNAEIDLNIAQISPWISSLTGPLRLDATAERTGETWQIDLDAAGLSGAVLSAQGTVAKDFSRADLSTEGSAPLALVNGLTDAARLTGQTRFNLGLRGPLALSSLSGTVDISGARLSVADPQVALNNIGANVRISSGSAAISGNGGFVLGGDFDLEGRMSLSAPYSADLTTRLKSARLRYERLVETVLQGDIRINGPLTGGATISGDVLLDETEIRVDSVASSSAPLPEITHLNAPSNVTRTRVNAGAVKTGNGQSGPAYRLNLGISAPNRVFVRGRGLDAEFNGALRLRGDTTNIVTAGGFDLVRGRMEFLTKRFDLSEGAIRLRGDFVPDLRLVATTETSAARFDLTLEGSADAPTFSINSSPDMPEDEALAQLLFGESMADISPLQAARLAGAVATLSGRSTFNPLGSLREGAGIDDLDLRTDAEGNTSVTAGKYISDNVYTEVEVGDTGESAISLNLDVSPNLTVKGTADSEANSGLGLFFQKDY